ncbi:hypothetical protein GCM10023339_02550 [Alloalcanivorax gelatiniphagus]
MSSERSERVETEGLASGLGFDTGSFLALLNQRVGLGFDTGSFLALLNQRWALARPAAWSGSGRPPIGSPA